MPKELKFRTAMAIDQETTSRQEEERLAIGKLDFCIETTSQINYLRSMRNTLITVNDSYLLFNSPD